MVSNNALKDIAMRNFYQTLIRDNLHLTEDGGMYLTNVDQRSLSELDNRVLQNIYRRIQSQVKLNTLLKYYGSTQVNLMEFAINYAAGYD